MSWTAGDRREATARVLSAGMSPELIGAFADVSEATTADGAFKFPQAICRALARAIVCRAYATPVYQLCHLVNVADACGRGNERFEWLFFAGGRLNARHFRDMLADAAAARGWRRPGFALTDNGVAIDYADGVFNVPYSRMPLLAAVLEFLVSAVPYAEVDDAFSEMFADASRLDAVGAAANALQRRLYAYLAEHLTSAQEQDKFAALIEFLEEHGDGESLVIDDDAVLAFWRRASARGAEGKGDFRTYRTVYEAFIDLMRCLDVADTRFAVENATPIGADAESGEIDVEALEPMVAALGEWRSPLAILEDGPASRIKMLNMTELGYVRMLCESGPLADRLPVSLLRCECFGAVQARLTQALRRKLAGDGVAELIRCEDAESYRERHAGYGALRRHIDRVLKAAAYATLRDRAVAQCDNVVALHQGAPAGPIDDVPGPNRGDLDAALDEARRAFARISRRGFDEESLDDEEIVEGFALGAGALMAADALISEFVGRLDALDREAPGLAGRFVDDRNAFREQFAELYGDRG